MVFSPAWQRPVGAMCSSGAAPRDETIDGDRAAETRADLIATERMSLEGSQQFPKTARLRKRAEFLKLSRTGVKIQSANFVDHQPGRMTGRDSIRDHGQRQGRQLGDAQSDQAASSRVFSPPPRRVAAGNRYPRHRAQKRRRPAG